jgi:hypothetical protein
MALLLLALLVEPIVFLTKGFFLPSRDWIVFLTYG